MKQKMFINKIVILLLVFIFLNAAFALVTKPLKNLPYEQYQKSKMQATPAGSAIQQFNTPSAVENIFAKLTPIVTPTLSLPTPTPVVTEVKKENKTTIFFVIITIIVLGGVAFIVIRSIRS